ncbi:hypothetical protein HETIRDRAFT_454790 [Heterobasidion irregulare TC 32-1]|uniref:Uncharacterized protein n=1 Tax=Heterobasidion irregulare (strain TC 32-1) TaxID=747525 RepID=W4JXA4_HETIT|nr:uncharacterized protein HETIRDRAFT_454790 [Heterobasidion irregulare TC 32-1]ETW77516.1 hypothetical protein HETIRDRAFT_454790 [Heterobasidion irregulare TC 32-1]
MSAKPRRGRVSRAHEPQSPATRDARRPGRLAAAKRATYEKRLYIYMAIRVCVGERERRGREAVLREEDGGGNVRAVWVQ